MVMTLLETTSTSFCVGTIGADGETPVGKMTYRNRNPTVPRDLLSVASSQGVTLLDHQYQSKWQLGFEDHLHSTVLHRPQ